MRSNCKRILFAAGVAVLLALCAQLRAADELFPCDLQQPQTKIGCTTLTPLSLANEIRGAGIVSISNVTYSGNVRAAGKILGSTGAANILGLDSGMVMSTGDIATIVGPNTSPSAGTNWPGNSGDGDADLTALFGFTTHDATVLEFDFVPDKNKVFVQYVFASEEYNQFVNPRPGTPSFNDVFAFYVNGTNCATVGGQAVSIQTINGGGPALGTNPTRPELFINNDFQNGTAPRNTQMDGLTKVLTCQASVSPNVTNHIKLAIADAGDGNLDSIVVLRSASFTTTPPITIVKKTNATNNDGAQAPLISVGDPVQWSYVVTNSGFDTLTSVTVTDDKVGAISCPFTTLKAPPEVPSTMTCLANGVAAAGDYTNLGTVVGTSAIVGPIEDTNPDRFFGALPAIKIITKTDHTNNDAAPGPFVQTGSPVLWTYEVQNTGNVTLDNVIVSDNKISSVNCSLAPGGPPLTSLAAGEMMVCSATGVAGTGQYDNVGTAQGSIQVLNVDGSLKTVTVSDSNPDHHFGADPKLKISKKTDGTENESPPGIYILVGDAVHSTYDVKNTGNVPLTNVRVEDPIGTTVCTIPSLAVGVTNSACVVPDVAAAKGQQKTTAKAVSAFTVVTSDGSSTDVPVVASDDEYYFGADPHVTIVKKVDGSDHNTPPGAIVLAGDPIRWTYEVTSTGNVALTNVRVEDPAGVLVCTIPSVGVGETKTCTLDGVALKGQQKNTGYAVGAFTVVKADGTTKEAPVQASDDEYYFGADPHVTIVKKVDGSDHNAPPGAIVLAGDPIRWTYEVTNTGNVALTNVRVEDPAGVAICTIASLGMGNTSSSCALDGIALKGQQKNTGYAVASFTVLKADGTTTDAPVQASDDEYYFGADPHVTIVKKVDGSDHNAAPGALVLAGDPIRWTYEVTNTGNVALTNVRVEDPAGVLVCTISSVSVGETKTCALDGVALKGQQKNTGYAVGAFTVVKADGTTKDAPVQASDDEYYFGADPHVAIVKKVDGSDHNTPPGAIVLVGDPIRWTYEVTNTGNVALTNVRVEDPVGVAICTIASLGVGETNSACTLDGIALKGQQKNTGYAVAAFTVLKPDGTTKDAPVQASDDEYYLGADAHVALVKKVDGSDHNAAPGALVLAGDPIRWTYELTNTGNVPLTNVRVEDPAGSALCTIANLGVGETNATCTLDGLALKGQQKNTGYAAGTFTVVTVEGTTKDAPVQASDDEFYLGIDPHVTIVKKVDGSDHNAAPGATVLAGDAIRWTYDVTNTGNVALTNVRVEDPAGVPICTIASLGLGDTGTCTLDGVALKGQQKNTGYAVGAVTVLKVDGTTKEAPVQASDDEYYFGIDPHLVIVKKTNGVDSSQMPGPTILTGTHITWTYAVTNSGNVTLSDVAVTDDKEGAICTIASLAVGQTMNCDRIGTAQTGSYTNTGTASVTIQVLQVNGSVNPVVISAVHSNHYFGANPRLAIVKKTVTYKCVSSHGHSDDDDHDRKDGEYKDREYEKGKEGDKDWGAQFTSGGKDGKDGWDKGWDDDSHKHSDGAAECGHDKEHESDWAHDDDKEHGSRKDDGKQYTFSKSEGSDKTYDDMDHDGKDHDGKDRDGHDNEHDHGSFDMLVRTETDNNTVPGPLVRVGSKIGWTYTVTNTGNVPLMNVVVTDDHEGAICTIPVLAVGQTAPACEKSGVAIAGQYENVGTVIGNFGPVFVNDVIVPSVPVTASDLDHYLGGRAAIAIVKKTNGAKHDSAPGPTVAVGSLVTWTYVISNTGNLPLTGVKLVDDRVGPIACPSNTLTVSPAAGSTMTCTASGVAVSGLYKNTGTVTAMSTFESVTASDCDFYFGAETKPDKYGKRDWDEKDSHRFGKDFEGDDENDKNYKDGETYKKH